MIKKITILFFILIFSFGYVYSQDAKKDEQKDKFTTMNIMLTQVIDTPKGVILEYYAKDDIQYTYLPDRFFEESMAVRVWENDTTISPQANVVFKNGEQFKVKIYMPKNASSLIYRLKDFLSDKEKEAFKVKELKFVF
ncbi:MAG TPA: hypothetical protein PK771_03740 [Spirochaetota bacterium]|nr:hypothetical protein [Spirochaetota bacterium]